LILRITVIIALTRKPDLHLRPYPTETNAQLKKFYGPNTFVSIKIPIVTVAVATIAATATIQLRRGYLSVESLSRYSLRVNGSIIA
jgi:hypothetical protein